MGTSDPVGAQQIGPDSADMELGRLRAILGERFRIDGAISTRFLRTVYSGFDSESKRDVAVKVLAFDPDEHPDIVERLEQKLRSASELGYRGVNPPTHLAVMDGGMFYISHLAAGGSAADVLLSGETMSPADVQIVVREVAEALARAHRSGLIHGCLTPGNILFAADGHPRVSDFGITDTLIETGLISGTKAMRERAYAAPEQWRGLRVTGAVDQFSLAVIAYELLTGRCRLADPGAAGVWTLDSIDVLANVPLGPGVPLYVNEALRTALSPRPANRFTTIMDFAEAFSGSDASVQRGPPTHAAELGVRIRPRFRPPFLWLVVGAIIFVALNPRVSSTVRAAWNGFWASYSPPQVKVNALDLLDRGSNTPITAVTGLPHSNPGTPSWLARVESSIFDRSSSAPATAYLHIEVDRGSAVATIDGIPRGATPLVISVGAGHHVISVAGSSDYDPPIAGVNVGSGDTIKLSFRALSGR